MAYRSSEPASSASDLLARLKHAPTGYPTWGENGVVFPLAEQGRRTTLPNPLLFPSQQQQDGAADAIAQAAMRPWSATSSSPASTSRIAPAVPALDVKPAVPAPSPAPAAPTTAAKGKGKAKAAAVAPEDKPPPKKRGRKPSANAEEKRKTQNRAAQKAFRERREQHLKGLEDGIKSRDAQIATFREITAALQQENAALRSGANPPTSSFDIPPVLPDPVGSAPNSNNNASSKTESHASGSGGVGGGARSELGSVQEEDDEEREDMVVDPLQELDGDGGYAVKTLPPLTTSSSAAAAPSTNLLWDFDAPFDMTLGADVALPDSFLNMFDPSLFDLGGAGAMDPMGMGMLPPLRREGTATPATRALAAAAAGATGSGQQGGTEDDEPPPPEDVECAECDFDGMSCAYPPPWRPPALLNGAEWEGGKSEEVVWTAKQAWAKLASHELFEKCDTNDLCLVLKEMARCSADGRLVIPRASVKEVYASIPGRAREM